MSRGPHIPEIEIFLLLPSQRSKSLNYNFAILISKLQFCPQSCYGSPIYFALTLGPSFQLYRAIPGVWDVTIWPLCFWEYLVYKKSTSQKQNINKKIRQRKKSKEDEKEMTQMPPSSSLTLTMFFKFRWFFPKLNRKNSITSLSSKESSLSSTQGTSKSFSNNNWFWDPLLKFPKRGLYPKPQTL